MSIFPMLVGASTPESDSSSSPTSPTPAPPSNEPLPAGTDIRDWMKQSGGKHLLLDDGVYTAGSISVTHAEDLSKDFDGWLVLEAKNKHQAIVRGTQTDSNTFLNLTGGNARILFVGVAFEDMTLKSASGSSNMRFWHCTHRYDYTTYDSGVQAQPVPRFWHMLGDKMESYGSDFYDGVATIINNDGSDLVVKGARMWNVSESRATADPKDTLHVNNITVDGGDNFVISDCYSEGNRIRFGAGLGTTNDITSGSVSNVWYAQPFKTGWLWMARSDKGTPYSIGTSSAVTLNNVNMWRDDGEAVNMNHQAVDGVVITPDTSARINVSYTNVNNTAPVSGLTAANALNHAQNPALVWRNTAGQGYGDWRTFFGW